MMSVMKHVLTHPDVNLRILCGDPAHHLFRTELGDHEHVECVHVPEVARSATDDNARRLLDICEAELKAFGPSVIVGGLSGPLLGIDEALVHAAGPSNCISIQDWPGWVVPGFGRPAGHYLVQNRYAAEITTGRGVLRATEVGCLSHASLFSFEEKASAPANRGPLFLGQPLHHLPGYVRTLARLADVLERRSIGWRYRAHPAESMAELRALRAALADYRIEIIDPGRSRLEDDLVSSTLVISCFSSAVEDRLILGTRPGVPQASAIYLLHEADVRTYHDDHSSGEDPYAALCGLATLVRDAEGIDDAIDHAIPADSASVLDHFPAPRPEHAAKLILELK